ncbi:hypothetical protein ICN46_06120 [Polynucleobacter sp. Latsch14-2]|jgi:hypothetical protein|uniref:hypothetical protein n=1 Tax=Polynucleobacter sp. Latsch14-2 TaxID=2576920 RepID=UPI001C0CA547|nr:hypothetical protein [Polynucleobacter sp. Latsch14-2]MBU3614469.1 hypothetical protein [Polynucleobacter sp. Latsch14-2]
MHSAVLHPPNQNTATIQNLSGETKTPTDNIKLTQAQTQELKAIWAPIRRNQLVDDRKSAPIWIRLSQPEAQMSRAQLFACATILADLDLDIPPFIHDILYGTEQ